MNTKMDKVVFSIYPHLVWVSSSYLATSSTQECSAFLTSSARAINLPKKEYRIKPHNIYLLVPSEMIFFFIIC